MKSDEESKDRELNFLLGPFTPSITKQQLESAPQKIGKQNSNLISAK